MNAPVCDLAQGAQHNFTRPEYDHSTGGSTTYCTRCGARLQVAKGAGDANAIIPATVTEDTANG